MTERENVTETTQPERPSIGRLVAGLILALIFPLLGLVLLALVLKRKPEGAPRILAWVGVVVAVVALIPTSLLYLAAMGLIENTPAQFGGDPQPGVEGPALGHSSLDPAVRADFLKRVRDGAPGLKEKEDTDLTNYAALACQAPPGSEVTLAGSVGISPPDAQVVLSASEATHFCQAIGLKTGGSATSAQPSPAGS